MKKCPCGNEKNYDDCCGQFINQHKIPATPEELMRSRYTAYSKANIDYIVATMKSPASDGYDAASARKWARNIHWLNLQVMHSRVEGTTGYVEFIATYLDKNIKQEMREVSEFRLVEGRWYYVSGKSDHT